MSPPFLSSSEADPGDVWPRDAFDAAAAAADDDFDDGFARTRVKVQPQEAECTTTPPGIVICGEQLAFVAGFR